MSSRGFALSTSTIGALLITAGLAYLLYSQVYEFRNVQELGSGIFVAQKPVTSASAGNLQFLYPGIRWNHIPVTVYLDMQNTPAGWEFEYADAAERAMAEMERTTAGLVTFSRTGDPNTADISIKWVQAFSYARTLDAVGHADVTFVPLDGRALIRKAKIEMLTMSGSRQLTGMEMQNTVLHELGHSMGLNHTDDQKSIMYPVANENVLAPSEADAATLRDVYKNEALADLLIDSANARKKAQKGVLLSRYYLDGNVTIRNTGYIDVPNVIVIIKADDRTVHEETIARIDSGQSIEYRFENIDAQEDFSRVYFDIDLPAGIREYSETNNAAVIGV